MLVATGVSRRIHLARLIASSDCMVSVLRCTIKRDTELLLIKAVKKAMSLANRYLPFLEEWQLSSLIPLFFRLIFFCYVITTHYVKPNFKNVNTNLDEEVRPKSN